MKNIKTIVIVVLLTTIILMATDFFEFEKPNKASQYPPSLDFKAAVESAMDEILPDKVLNLLWKNTFHWLTLFESVDGFVQTIVGTGTVTLDGNDVVLATSAVANDSVDLAKEPSWLGLATFSQRSFMRSAVVVNSITSQEIYIKVGRSDTQGYGFKIINGSLYGTTHSGTTESTVLLQTISISTAYQLEARYLPSDKVVFFVDTIEKGVLTTNLPSPAVTANDKLMTLRVKTTTTAARNMQVSYFEYLQRRNILQ